MADPTAKLLLEIVNAYENTPRALLAHNARRAMEPLKLTERQQYLWIADLCGTGRDSTYFWFAPNRESKIPLRVVARMADALGVSPFVFFELSAEPSEIQLRRKKPRPSYEAAVAELLHSHPEKSIREMAAELGVAQQTVRRHLMNIKEKKNERT